MNDGTYGNYIFFFLNIEEIILIFYLYQEQMYLFLVRKY